MDIHKSVRNSIYYPPVDKLIDKICDCEKNNILLVGGFSTGKTTVLEEYKNVYQSDEEPIIDITVKETLIVLPDKELFELSQVCLMLKKMLEHIKENNIDVFLLNFSFFNSKIENIFRNINEMYSSNNYKLKNKILPSELCLNPEILLEEFLSIASKHLDYKNITLIIDNFDTVGASCRHYQKYMYNLLSKYFQLILAVSDTSILTDMNRRDILEQDNDIVELNYSFEVENIKSIIDSIFNNRIVLANSIGYQRKLKFLLSDEEIKIMILKTNGNIFDMCLAIRHLYNNIDKVSEDNYGAFVLNYIDNVINKDPRLSGYIKPVRTLHI